jgi:hypothetical protein
VLKTDGLEWVKWGKTDNQASRPQPQTYNEKRLFLILINLFYFTGELLIS